MTAISRLEIVRLFVSPAELREAADALERRWRNSDYGESLVGYSIYGVDEVVEFTCDQEKCEKQLGPSKATRPI